MGAVVAEAIGSGTVERLRHPRLGTAQRPDEDRAAFEARVARLAGPGALGGIVGSAVPLDRSALVVEHAALVWIPG